MIIYSRNIVDAVKPERRAENLIYTSNFLIIMEIELPSTYLITETFKAPLLAIPSLHEIPRA